MLKLTRLSGQSVKDCLRIDMFSNGGVANIYGFYYYSGVLWEATYWPEEYKDQVEAAKEDFQK